MDPRLGFAFDLADKTVVKATFGIFSNGMDSAAFADAYNPLSNSTMTYRWRDLNGNRDYDAGEVNLDPSGADFIWCASQHHKFDPRKPARKWDSAWRALRDAAGLPGLRFHDLRHTVVTRLLEAGEPDHVVESITGHLSRRMLEHYSHIRLKAKKAALDRLDESGRATSIKIVK